VTPSPAGRKAGGGLLCAFGKFRGEEMLNTSACLLPLDSV